jgi:hypothetical protein
MPFRKRPRPEPIEDWSQLQLQLVWPEQVTYGLIRPVVLFRFSPAERARQTGIPERTIYRKASRCDALGLAGLLKASGDRLVKPQDTGIVGVCYVEVAGVVQPDPTWAAQATGAHSAVVAVAAGEAATLPENQVGRLSIGERHSVWPAQDAVVVFVRNVQTPAIVDCCALSFAQAAGAHPAGVAGEVRLSQHAVGHRVASGRPR